MLRCATDVPYDINISPFQQGFFIAISKSVTIDFQDRNFQSWNFTTWKYLSVKPSSCPHLFSAGFVPVARPPFQCLFLVLLRSDPSSCYKVLPPGLGIRINSIQCLDEMRAVTIAVKALCSPLFLSPLFLSPLFLIPLSIKPPLSS